MRDRSLYGADCRGAAALLVAPLLIALTLGMADSAPAAYRYERSGAYLDYPKRPSLLRGFAPGLARYKIVKGDRGVAEIYPDGTSWLTAISDSQYGLWHFTRFKKTGRRYHLAQAERAARWVERKQDPTTGIYHVHYPYDVGPRKDGSNDLLLTPPWYGANAQAIPVSLLSRLYRATHKQTYLRQAEAALRPLGLSREQGGVRSTFLGSADIFFEGYATLPVRVHTLSHHVQTLIALYDMSDLSPLARQLFDRGMTTLRNALVYYDLPQLGRVAVWLLHLTDPTRDIPTLSGWFQEPLVAQLWALESVRPDPVLAHYARAWNAQLQTICRNPGEHCFFRH